MTIIERRAPVPGAAAWDWPKDYHRVLRQVLTRRPLKSPSELELELNGLIPVGRFEALREGVKLLLKHRDRQIVIVGDFDADGATSTALGVLTLKRLGFARVDFFIPDRFSLGYGLSSGVTERLKPKRPSLIVTVDNGISSYDGVAAARDAGIDVLVTDHHLPPAVLPPANVIINPNLPGDSFQGKQLAGVGVMFYLLAALGRAHGEPAVVAEYLDLVAVGTVADLVPLDHSNRILVEQGLRRIRKGRCRAGLRALCDLAAVDISQVTTATLGFQLGPRLNAAGRLDDMTIGVRCLIADSDREARHLATELDRLNRDRRQLEMRMKSEALALVDGLALANAPAAICVSHSDWHEGLVGLIASRVKEKFHRPTFAFAPSDSGDLKGSGRSIPGFHLRDALADVDATSPGLIKRFGGHAMAAGLSLARDSLAEFERAIADAASRRMDQSSLAKKVMSDGDLAPADMNLSVASMLRDAAPWGQGFPEPCFDGYFDLLESRVLKGQHLKMKLRSRAGGDAIDAIAFHQASVQWEIGTPRRLAYRLAVNDYSSPASVQLIVELIVDES